MTYEPAVYALIRAASEGPSEATLTRAPEALVRFCGTPRQLADLYPWGERRKLRPRMVRGLVRQLLDAGQLAGDDPAALPDWSWLWDPRVASGPGTPPAFDPATDPRTGEAETPEQSADRGEEEEAPEEAASEEDEEEAPRTLSRSARRREVPARTEDPRRYSKAWQREIAQEAATHPGGRPQTRGECPIERPCPWVSCRHHLYLDVDEATGSIKLNFPDLEPEEMVESCSLDVADRGGASLAEAGAAMNVTRERTRQLEASGLRHLARRAPEFAEHTDAHEPRPRRVLPVLSPTSRTTPPATPRNPTSFEEPKREAVHVAPVVTRKTPVIWVPEPAVEEPAAVVVEEQVFPEESPPVEPENPPVVVAVEELFTEEAPVSAPIPPSEWPPEALAWLARCAKIRTDLETAVALRQVEVEKAQAELQESLDLLESVRASLAEAAENCAAGRPFHEGVIDPAKVDSAIAYSAHPATSPLRERILAALTAGPGTQAELARRLGADRYQVHARLQDLLGTRKVVQLEDGRYCLVTHAPAPQPVGWAPGTVSANASKKSRILAELEKGDLTVSDLATRLGVPYRRLYAPLRGLAASGDAVQLDDGRWGLMMRQTG